MSLLKNKLEEALAEARDIAKRTDLNDEERADFAKRVENIETMKAKLAEEEELRSTIASLSPAEREEAVAEQKSYTDLGRAWTSSQEYAAAKAAGFIGNSAPFEFKAEPTAIDEATALSAFLEPQRVGQLTALPTFPQTVASLIPSISTSSNAVSYISESSETHTIDTAAEGAEKGNFTLDGTSASEEVEVIAGMAAITRQVLEDLPFMAGFVNQRMTLALRKVEEQQILSGSGVSPDLNGLLTRTTTTLNQGADTVIDAIYKASNDAYLASGLRSDAIVINAADWETIQLVKGADERYLGAGPFSAAQGPTLWGLQVVVSENIAANTVLVGAFRDAAFLARNGGLTLRTSDSHSDYFKKNKVAVLIEERLALGVYSPLAFCELTLGV